MASSTPALKVILCGEYGSGKSSIFRRFVDNSFLEETGPRSTIGLDNFTKNFKIEDEIAKIQLWDTAGIERFATMSSSYYQGAHAAILCYAVNDRQSFNMLSQHIIEIVMHGRTAKIFLCGNKLDLEENCDEKVADEDVETFQMECDSVLSGIYKISCRTGEGVKEMFDDVAAVVRRQAAEKFDPNLIQPHWSHLVEEPQKQKCCTSTS